MAVKLWFIRLIAIFLTVSLIPAFAQAKPDEAPQTTLTVTTRLIEFSVVAQTKDGEPVIDLTHDEFTVFDEGEEQQLSIFAIESSRLHRKPAHPLPPNTFTNRFEQLGEAPTSVTVVLFDGLNTHIVDQVYAKHQIVRFIETLQPGDRVAVYVMGRGPRVVQEFTGDSSALAERLKNYSESQSPSLDAPLYDPAISPTLHFDAWLGELSFNLVDYFDRDRAFRTVRAITAIARHVERLPGRKNLIWVSGSFPISISGGSLDLSERVKRGASKAGWPETDRLARALSRANLAIYPVDARGLIAPREYRADSSVLASDDRLRDTQMFSVMRTLAERTGGRAFYNNNDLSGAFRRAAGDARFSYILGYYPSHDDWSGKFRKVTIETDRPGVELHHRTGYFAQPDEPQEQWYREETFEAAMFSPLDASGIGLTVTAAGSDGDKLDLDLGIDAGDITFQPARGKWECSLDIWLIQMDRNEKHLKTDARTTNLSLEQLDYERVMRARGLRLAETIKPSKKAMLVRVMVRDVSSGALGSVIIPLERLRN